MIVSSTTFLLSQTPNLTGVSPSAWTPGMQVTLTGSGFGATPSPSGSGIYLFGAWGSIVSWSDTQIVFTVPSGIGPGNVLVVQNYVNSNSLSYTMIPPVLSSISPTAWSPGMQVTLTGSGFGTTQSPDGSGVYLFGTWGSIVSWSNTQIVFTVPSGIGPGNVLVEQDGVNSNALSYTMSPGPSITSLSPSSAAAGSLVTISGSNLSAGDQQPIVSIGGIQVTGNQVSSTSSTSVIFLVPSAAVSGNVTVQLAGGTSNSLPFTVLTPPQIYNLAPLEIAPNGLLTISGIYFGSNGATGNSLLIDGQTTAASNWTNTQITVQVPSSPGAHTVTVVAGGVQTPTVPFIVLSYGAISGNVTANGSPVPGATVQGAAGESALTDNGGNFSFSSVPTGTYTLGATASGYIPAMIGEVSVSSGATTNVQIQLAVPNPTQLTIVPNGVTISVGGGQNLSLVDQNGMPVTGATWSVSDSTIALIDSTDNSVVGVAAGTTTLNATWQGLSANAPVNVIAPGNTLWSSQLNNQQGPALPLARTGTGPDFVYTDSTNLYGVSYDNGVMWQQSLQDLPTLMFAQQGSYTGAAADENGDFVVQGSDPATGVSTITEFSGTTGLPEWTHYYEPDTYVTEFAVDSSGNVFPVIFMSDQPQTGLQELSSSNGQAILFQPFSNNADGQTPYTDQPSVLSDGSVSVQYVQELSDTTSATSVHQVSFSPSTGGATDTILDSSVASSMAVSSDMSLPDGNGGIITAWRELTDTFNANLGITQQTSETILFNDSTTGMTFQSTNAGVTDDPEPMVLGNTGLLYYVAAQFGACSGFDCMVGENLIAMNVSTGSEAWRVPVQWSNNSQSSSGIPYSNLVAATSDGGVLISGTTGVARVDTNGNVTPDSDLSPYLQTYGIFSYLGGPDGTLWNSSASDTTVSDNVDEEETDGDTVSDWITPSGHKNAYRAAKSAQFMDSDINYHCGGFDGNFNPHILAVPVNGTNQVLLQIKGAWQNVTLQSDTPSVTVSPTAPTGNKTVLTVNGGPTAVLARIKAINSNGSHMATLRVAVQSQIQPATVLDLYPVTEANEYLVGTAPDPTDVLNELQITFGRHANLFFTVNVEPTVNVAYDLNDDRALQDPTGNNNYTEESAIVNYITNNGGVLGDIWASYVYDINPHTTEGMTSSLGGRAEFIRNNTNPPPNGQPWVTAHETGHALGLQHPEDYLQNKYHDVQDVMTKFDPGTGPCRLHVDQWDQLNPTGSNQSLTQWELAPWQHPADD